MVNSKVGELGSRYVGSDLGEIAVRRPDESLSGWMCESDVRGCTVRIILGGSKVHRFGIDQR